jgi:hypothetical protein
MIDRNVMSQTSPASGTSKNGNNTAVTADDGFTAVKRTKAKKETSSTSSQSLKEHKQPLIGVGNSFSLPTIAKWVKIKYLSVVSPLRFRPQILKKHHWSK